MSDDNIHYPFSWPTKGQKAFVEAHPGSSAFIAQDTKERLWRMVKGYHLAADILVEKAEDQEVLARNLIYPIVFNYRHSIELALKWLIAEHGKIIDVNEIFNTHNIGEIWPHCRRLTLKFNKGADITSLDALEKLILEFSEMDASSFSFRYAKTNKGVEIRIKSNAITLSELKEAVSGIHTMLECIESQIDDALENLNELEEY